MASLSAVCLQASTLPAAPAGLNLWHRRDCSALLRQGFVASESPGDAWHVCSQRPARPRAPDFDPLLVTSSRFRNRLGNINAKIAAQRVEETSPQKWKEA